MANFKENETYKQVLAYSCGGLMYDVANKGKYDADALIAEMEAHGVERMDGIAKGVYEFLTGAG